MAATEEEQMVGVEGAAKVDGFLSGDERCTELDKKRGLSESTIPWDTCE